MGSENTGMKDLVTRMAEKVYKKERKNILFFAKPDIMSYVIVKYRT